MESENKKTLEEALADLEARKAAVAEWKRQHGPALDAATAKNDALNARVAALSQEDPRQVFDAAGMKHVSAAPPPLEHIRGSGYSQPNKPPKPIDWGHWGFLRDCDVSLWQAVALSVNINPDAVQLDRAGEDFSKRLGIAIAHGASGSLPLTPCYANQPVSAVILARFAAWCVKIELADLPPELVAMALQPAPVAPTAPAQNTATPAPVVAASDVPVPLTTAPAQTAKPAPVETAKRKAKKPSIETVALDYMREAYKVAQFQSSAAFHKHLIKTAGANGSPFEKGTGGNAGKLFCPAASTFFDVGTLGKIWAKIRAA